MQSSTDDVDTLQLSKKEYRDWVNDQVASALLKRILLIGFGGIVAVTSLYFAAQNFLLDFQKGSIVKDVQSGMTEQISMGISDVLISKSAIIDSLAGQGVKVANALLENPDFVSSVQDRILAEVIRDNSLDRVILATARGQVESATQPATKAMGLRLYSLFYGNIRWDGEVQPLRSVYRAALGDGEVGRDEQLLSVVLQQYPLGVRSDPECVTLPASCDAYDKDVLGRVFAILGEGELPGTITSDLERFVSTMPEASLAQSLTWLELNAARPLARFILESWLKDAPSASREFEFGITGLETLLRSEDVRAQDEALRILAEMDADSAISQSQRMRLLTPLWSPPYRDNLWEALAVQPAELVTSLSQPERSNLTPEQLRLGRAAVNLIRVSGSEATEVRGEWHTLSARLSPSAPGTGETMLRAAWMARLLLDNARAPQMPITPAVELILENPEVRALASPVEQHVLSAAVQLAGGPAYKKFLANYVDALGRLGADTIIGDRVLAAAATRDIENEFETFVDILMGNPEMPTPLPRHVRTSMIETLLDLSPDHSGLGQLQADLSYAAQRDRANRLVALLKVSEPVKATLGAQNALAVDLVLGLTENRRATVSAIEDSGLLVRAVPERTIGKVEPASSVLDDQLQILKSALPWVGTAAQEPIEVAATLAAPTELQIRPGDQWLRLTVTEPVRVELLPPAGVEAAISDPLRKEYWGRSVSESSPAIRLAPATYMLLVRASEATDGRLTLRAVRPALSFTSSTSPYRITAPISADYLGATPGEDLWLQIDESLADRRIRIYTETPAGTEPSSSEETDSFLELFGSDLESPVLSDDDGAQGYNASLDFVPSEHGNARLIRVSEFTDDGPAHFSSESRFRLVVEISGQ